MNSWKELLDSLIVGANGSTTTEWRSPLEFADEAEWEEYLSALNWARTNHPQWRMECVGETDFRRFRKV